MIVSSQMSKNSSCFFIRVLFCAMCEYVYPSPPCLQFKRKSTEGVSYFLFALVILGNVTYGLSVLLKNPERGQGEESYMVHHLPWLIGSLGTLTLDLIVSFLLAQNIRVNQDFWY